MRSIASKRKRFVHFFGFSLSLIFDEQVKQTFILVNKGSDKTITNAWDAMQLKKYKNINILFISVSLWREKYIHQIEEIEEKSNDNRVKCNLNYY